MVTSARVQKQSAAQQVVQILIDRIRIGEYEPEMRLPSEDALGEELGVSRTTVRSALDALAAQHLVVRRHGVGTFVSNLSHIPNPLNQAVMFQDLIRSNGYEPGIRWLSVTVTQPDGDLAKSLQTPAAEPVVEVRKIFTADGTPVIYCTNYIPSWVLGETLLDEILANPEVEEPLFDFLDTRCGHKVDHFVATVWPELVGEAGFDEQGIDPKLPALVIDEVGYDRQERPVVRSIHHYPGRRMNFVFFRHFYGDFAPHI
jgi:GntR family transcriptional regulator